MWTALIWLGTGVGALLVLNVTFVAVLAYANRNRQTWPERLLAQIQALPETAEPAIR